MVLIDDGDGPGEGAILHEGLETFPDRWGRRCGGQRRSEKAAEEEERGGQTHVRDLASRSGRSVNLHAMSDSISSASMGM